MADSLRRFFMALLPPEEVQAIAWAIKQEFAEHYHSKAALRSPPHVTLQPPFTWKLEELPQLEQDLINFAARIAPVPMILKDFDVFKPKVIFIHVKPTESLLSLQRELSLFLNKYHQLPLENRPFHPHLTVGFRDLDKANFQKAWAVYQKRPLYFEFEVPQLTLLIHDGQRWQIQREFPFLSP